MSKICRDVVSAALVAAALLMAPGCGDDGGTDDPHANADVVFWAPRHLGMEVLWVIDLEERLAAGGVVGALVEEDLAFIDIEPRVRHLIDTNTLDADVIMVPWGVGQRLLADGLIVEPYTEVFSVSDPDEAAEILPVIVAQPSSAMARAGAPRRTESAVTFGPDGCLTAESRQYLAGQLATSAQVYAALGTAPLLDDWQFIDGTVTATGEAAKDKIKDQAVDVATGKPKERAIATATMTLADAYSARLGETAADRAVTQAVALKAVGAACKVVSAALDYKDFLKLMYTSVDTADATASAYESALQTFVDASGQISDLRTELFEMQLGIRDCSLSGQEALDRLDEMTTRLTSYQMTARAGITEMTTINGTLNPQVEEQLDNIVQRFTEKWTQVRAEAQAKADAVNSSNSTLQTVLHDDPATTDPDWEAFAELLTGQELGNDFVHSNGTLTTMSAGNTDLIRAGGGWVDLSADAVDYLFGANGRYPCGMGSLATTLCGGLTFPAGPARVIVADYGATLPPPSGGYHYQYGFVFDADNMTSNNYLGSVAYPKDLFDNTDLWFEAKVDATTSAWSFTSTLARDGAFQSRQTAARTIISGNSMVIVIPGTEFETTVAPYRVTAFRHRGDFGIDPPHDFNGDVWPTVGMPLATLSMTTTFPARYDSRMEKTEYTAETSALGASRIGSLAVPATVNHDLATSAGAFGYRAKIGAAATVRFCVSASMPASVNYYPQFSPGYTFVDGAPGCTDVTNIDANLANWVLVKVAGAGSPNNITVTSSVP